MGTPFKMKGSPMARNFGIGSPVKGKIPTDIEETTKTDYKSSKSKSTQNELLSESREIERNRKRAEQFKISEAKREAWRKANPKTVEQRRIGALKPRQWRGELRRE